MTYDFDKIIDRTESDCEKYGHTATIFGTADVLPLWIADMDFASGDFIIDAIKRRADHMIFGYTFRSECYNDAIIRWLERRTGWHVVPEWLAFSPGVVAGVTFAMLATTHENDGVLIQPPVYHPFARAINLNNRRVVTNPLLNTPAGYVIDFEDFEAKIQQVKAFILCNPHNPTGRCFTRDELRLMGELCVKHGVRIISDEIHSDFVFKPHFHTHIASISPDFAEHTITLIAPSKSFNIAGFCTAVAIIPNAELMCAYQTEIMKIHVDNSNIFGAEALKAAYTKGDEWMDQMVEYLDGNIDMVITQLRDHIPSVRCHKPEATFLLWLDFSQWGLTQEQLNEFLIKEAHLGMNCGTIFGEEGYAHERMNVGAPRSVIQRAVNQLIEAAVRRGF